MKCRSLMLFWLCLGLFMPAARAASAPPLPADLPAFGPAKPFTIPNVIEEKLPNGLTVWLVPRAGFPKVGIALAAQGGLAADPAGRPGLSELLLETLDQGTKGRNALQIAEALQAAGGDLEGEARPDALLIGTSVLSDRAVNALEVMADVCRNATFPEEEVERAKRNAIEALRQQESSSWYLARRTLVQAMFGDHPYGVYGPTDASIQQTTAAELRAEYARRFRPDRMLLVAVGDFDAKKMKGEVRRLFGKWSAPKGAPVGPVPAVKAPEAKTVYVVHRPRSVQVEFNIGMLVPTRRDPDYARLEMARNLFGGMFGSRLNKNLREDKGYTYGAGAGLETRRETGLLQAGASVRNEVAGAAWNELNYELNRMATTVPTAEEVDHARRDLFGSEARRLQSIQAVANQLLTLWTQGLPWSELKTRSERIQAVTAEEIAAVGRKYFGEKGRTIVLVGDEEAIRAQLEPLGLEIKRWPVK